MKDYIKPQYGAYHPDSNLIKIEELIQQFMIQKFMPTDGSFVETRQAVAEKWLKEFQIAFVDYVRSKDLKALIFERVENREQQIAEMAATIITAYVFEKEDYAMEAAKALYNAGYRKGAKK